MLCANEINEVHLSQVYNAILRRRMKGKRTRFLEYIWQKKFVHGQRCDLFLHGMNYPVERESGNKNYNVTYMTAFSFLEAVREHRDVVEIEEHRKGSQPDRFTYSYADALKYAVLYGHKVYSEYLLEHNLEEALLQNVCCPLILLAVRLGQPQIVELLCKFSGKKIIHNSYIDKSGCSAMEMGRTALHIAAESGHAEITKVLLKYGADTMKKDDFGRSPLNRVLFRLRPPHINHKTVQCAIELIKCETVLSKDMVEAIENLVQKSNACSPVKYDLDKMAIKGGPFSLQHMCRAVIRRNIGYPKLPDGLPQLGLPASLLKFVNLQSET